MSVFLREFIVPAELTGDSAKLTFMVTSPKAYVDHVRVQREYFEGGQGYQDNIHVAVRDQGSPVRVSFALDVVLVRRLNDLVPLPDDCGKCLGYLQSNAGRFACYVFSSRHSPRRASSSSEETTSPPPERAASTPAPQRDASACSCVFDGTSIHASAAQPSEQKPAEDESQFGFGFPSDEPVFGA